MNRTALRRAGTAALSALALTMAAACGGDDGGSGSADSADLVWQFWTSGSEDQAAWQKVADQVTKDHPGIKVKLQGTSWENYWAKIGTQLAGSDAPCLVGMQSLRLASYGKALRPLDDLMSKYGVKAEDFDKPILDGLKADGKQVAIPYDTGPMVVFYNRDAFTKGGVTEPKPGWTMDQFRAAATKLTTGGKYGFVTSPGDLSSLPWVLTLTGAEPVKDGNLQLTSAEFVDGYRQYVDLVQKDKVAPEVPSADGDFQVNQFVAGKAAMMVDGPWSVLGMKNQVKFNLGIAPMPAGPDGSKSYTAGSGFGISRACKNPDAAFQAIATMTGQQPLTELAAAGRAYPSRTKAQDAWYKAADIKGARETLDFAATHSTPLVTSTNWVKAENLYGQFGVQALNGDVPPDQAMKQVQDQAGTG
jgi:multiple sugar transport system substrate-binding protein